MPAVGAATTMSDLPSAPKIQEYLALSEQIGLG
jgi:hypothetical protein